MKPRNVRIICSGGPSCSLGFEAGVGQRDLNGVGEWNARLGQRGTHHEPVVARDRRFVAQRDQTFLERFEHVVGPVPSAVLAIADEFELQRQQDLVGEDQGFVALGGTGGADQRLDDHRKCLRRLLQPAAVFQVEIGVRLAGDPLGDRLHAVAVERGRFRRFRRVVADQRHFLVVLVVEALDEIGEFLLVEAGALDLLHHFADGGFDGLRVAGAADLGLAQGLIREAPGALDRRGECRMPKPDAEMGPGPQRLDLQVACAVGQLDRVFLQKDTVGAGWPVFRERSVCRPAPGRGRRSARSAASPRAGPATRRSRRVPVRGVCCCAWP